MTPDQPSPPAPDDAARRRARALTGRGAIAGVVTALVALGAAQLTALLLNAAIGAPVDAVGEVFINHTPSWLKNFAIREFGSYDKTVLVWGIRVVLIILAAVIGVIAMRRLWAGMVGLALFTAIGVYAGLSQPTSGPIDAWPTLIGAAAAALTLRSMTRLAVREADRTGYGRARAASRPAASPPPAPDRAPGEPARPWIRDDVQPVTHPERRRFLVVSGTAAAVSLVAYVGGTWLGEIKNVSTAIKTLRLPAATDPAPPLPPGSNLPVRGISPFITPNAKFYRVDTALILPEILPADWQLRIHGMVQREITLTFDDLIKRPLLEDYITLCCVSNPVGGPYIGNAKWLGASLRSLLQEAGIKAGADELFCTSWDGFTSGTPVQTAMDGRDALLAVAMNDAALPVEHGFPVRLVIPGLYGYVSACKWITDIEVTTYAANSSYWAQRGWAEQAPVKTESRIDVPGPGTLTARTRTAIAGVAWAQHKGIEAVEVRIGGGPWHEAQLAAVPDIDTWRQWVYYWDTNVPAGNYLIEARATDRTGYTQTAVQAPPEPNGASGYPQVVVSVTS